MDKQIMNRLSVALDQLELCRVSGTESMIIQNGYASIDNHFSALLMTHGHKNIKFHKEKKNKALDIIKQKLIINEINPNEISKFHDDWFECRYEQNKLQSITPFNANRYLTISIKIRDIVLSEISDILSIDLQELYKDIYNNTFGDDLYAFNEGVMIYHNMRQDEIDRLKDEGICKSPIGTKICDVSNFCNIHLFTKDEKLRELLIKGSEFDSCITQMYRLFCEMTEKIFDTREDEGISIENSMNFCYNIMISFQGMSLSEIGESRIRPLYKHILESFNRIKKRKN